jgi:hypothetical protein
MTYVSLVLVIISRLNIPKPIVLVFTRMYARKAHATVAKKGNRTSRAIPKFCSQKVCTTGTGFGSTVMVLELDHAVEFDHAAAAAMSR